VSIRLRIVGSTLPAPIVALRCGDPIALKHQDATPMKANKKLPFSKLFKIPFYIRRMLSTTTAFRGTRNVAIFCPTLICRWSDHHRVLAV